MTEQDRLVAIEQGLRDVKSEVGATRGEVGEVKQTVARLEATVELLVQGKISQSSGGGGSGTAGQQDPWSKVTMAAMEVARLAVAAMAGFFAGRGGN